MIVIGNFKGRNLCYDKETGLLYASEKICDQTNFTIKWPILAVGICGNTLISTFSSHYLANDAVAMLAGLLGVLMTSLALHFLFLGAFKPIEVELFNPSQYFEWPMFVQKEKDRLIIVLVTILFSAFLSFLLLENYLAQHTLENYIKFILVYSVLYMSLVGSNIFHRYKAYRSYRHIGETHENETET